MANDVDRLQVKIAILGLVNEYPEQPSVNELNEYIETQNSQSDRTLTIEHELSITQQLAFICAYSYDPLHIIAVCIEEAIDSRSLTIRIAANTGQHDNLVDGLKIISRILESEAKKGS